MGRFCKKHVKERTTAELKARRREIMKKAASGEKVGNGLLQELRNITAEGARREYDSGLTEAEFIASLGGEK